MNATYYDNSYSDSSYGRVKKAGKSHGNQRSAYGNPSKNGKGYNKPSVNYGNKSNIASAPKKNYKSATSSGSGSDSDSSIRSDFSGFRIVAKGSVLINEIEEDQSIKAFINDEQKFAGSTMTVGPNANEISLPGFLEEEFGEM